jgi:hypothetical protein
MIVVGALLCLFLTPVFAEDAVHFADEKLKALVEETLWISDPTPTDMLGLTSLDGDNKGITSLVGLEYATNLEGLIVRWDHIADLSPLSGLTNLRELDAHNNNIADISPLSNLVNLRKLVLRINHISDISALSHLVLLEQIHFEWNKIHDISALAGLTHLTHVDLRDNKIEDISALLKLPSVTFIDLRGNPLSKEAREVHIPQLLASREGLAVLYDPDSVKRHLRISCGPGGMVIYPGVGTLIYDDNASVRVQAQANPGFRFAYWSGSYSSRSNPLPITMSEDCDIRANFVSLLDTIHVDQGLAADPSVTDAGEDGTPERPFDQIQEAIEVAADGATVLVHPGTYRESIDSLGKSIKITGAGPEDRDHPTWPVIRGITGKPVVSFTDGNDPNCLLRGFVLTAGNSPQAGGLWCCRSRATVANCLIAGNRAGDPNGAIIFCTNSQVFLLNCTITDNHAGAQGATIYSADSDVSIVNSILWGNAPREIAQVGTAAVSARYSDIAGGWAGPGCFDADPTFADPGHWADRNRSGTELEPGDPNAIWVMGDYHLQSQAGRWVSEEAKWIQDEATSPCIDAGDPNVPVGEEPSPNAGIVNLGAYGGTATASKSCPHIVP